MCQHVFLTALIFFSGLIDWKEFHVQFLVAKGHDSKEAEKHAEDYETIAVDAGGTRRGDMTHANKFEILSQRIDNLGTTEEKVNLFTHKILFQHCFFDIRQRATNSVQVQMG